MMRRMFRVFLVLFLLGVIGVGVAAGVGAYLLLPELEKYEAPVLALKDRQAVGHGWQFHSRIYSRPLPLVPDTLLSPETLIEHLEARGYVEVKGKDAQNATLEPGQFRRAKVGIDVALRGYELPGGQAPRATVHLTFASKGAEGKRLQSVSRLGESGAKKGEDAPEVPYSLEPILLTELLGDPPRRSTFVALDRIPKHVQDAVLASEDRRFETHHGVDFRGLLRAVLRNTQSGAFRQGGSTITQQLARTLFLSTERTWRRKVAELGLALQLDKHLSKPRLLELYLNSVYLGQQEGVAIHGVAEAARAYFNQPIEELSIAQAATLSAIIPAPNAFSPYRYPERCTERRNTVLSLMLEQGRLTEAQVNQAREEVLVVAPGKPAPLSYGYYTGFVREFLKRTLGEGYEMRGLTVYSALDPVLQKAFEASLIQRVDAIARRFGSQPEPLMGAALMLDYRSGKVLAIAGGRGYEKNPFNRAFQSHRQPGSAFKPIAYATAIEGGEGLPQFSPATTVPDLRRAFQVKEGDWKPRNYEGDYHDTVTLAKALTKSLNVATVNIVDQVGPQQVAAMAKSLGLGELKPVLSIGLGTNEVTLEQMVRAYATFPSGGLEVVPQPVDRVVDLWGQDVYVPEAPKKRLIKQDTADLMVDLLRSVVVYGTSWTLRTQGYYNRPSGGKTGTSQDEQDAWYLGFTPDVLMGVWVGYDTPRHLYGSAADVAVPVWGGMMTDYMATRPPAEQTKDFEFPDSLEYVWLDPYTGLRATPLCPRTMRIAVLKGTAPKGSCPKTHEGEMLEEAEGGGEGGGIIADPVEGEGASGDAAPAPDVPPGPAAPAAPPAPQ